MSINDQLVVFFLSANNKFSKGFLLSSVVPTYVFLSTYRKFVKEEILTPIENLLVEEKRKLVDECRETKISFTNSTLVDAAKILHTIKFINENS